MTVRAQLPHKHGKVDRYTSSKTSGLFQCLGQMNDAIIVLRFKGHYTSDDWKLYLHLTGILVFFSGGLIKMIIDTLKDNRVIKNWLCSGVISETVEALI